MNVRGLNIILLAICLGLGFSLAFALSKLDRLSPTAAEEKPEIISNTFTQLQIAVRKVGASDYAAELSRQRPLTWMAIESTNYQHYIAKLEAIGCPEETVKDILLTDIAKLYGRKRAALLGDRPFEYWREDPGAGGDPAVRAQLEALDAERAALVYELLGVDFETEMSSYWGNDVEQKQQTVGFLPEEKRAGAWTIQQHFKREREALLAAEGGRLLPEVQVRLRDLRLQEEAELAQLLTPDELLDYQLRNSSTAEKLRSELAGFETSEAEFKSLFRLEKAFDEQFERAFDPADPIAQAAKARAEASVRRALEGEMLKLLGPDRYDEYVRVQDDDYRHLLRLGNGLEIPKQAARQVYEMKHSAEIQKQQVLANSELTVDQRRLALAAMAVEVERSVAEVLGAATYQSYRNSGAAWIGELARPDQTLLFPSTPPLPETPPPLPERR